MTKETHACDYKRKKAGGTNLRLLYSAHCRKNALDPREKT